MYAKGHDGVDIEELEGRDEGARERVEHLRAEITRLSEELTVAEEQLSRLTIARETVLEVLAGPELSGDLVFSSVERGSSEADLVSFLRTECVPSGDQLVLLLDDRDAVTLGCADRRVVGEVRR